MRISDWRSDVCSADLWIARASMQLRKQNGPPQGPVRYWMKDAAGSSSGRLGLVASGLAVVAALEHRRRHQASILADLLFDLRGDLRVLQIGRASCRGRVCQYV